MKRFNYIRRDTSETDFITGRWRKSLDSMWRIKGQASRASLCVASFNRWFDLPRGCADIDIVFSKNKHPEAYDILMCELYPGWDKLYINNQETGMMSGATHICKRLWNEGYNWVRVEVNS